MIFLFSYSSTYFKRSENLRDLRLRLLSLLLFNEPYKFDSVDDVLIFDNLFKVLEFVPKIVGVCCSRKVQVLGSQTYMEGGETTEYTRRGRIENL